MKIDISLWCDCKEPEPQEMKELETDHHGEMRIFICENCNKKVQMEISLHG